MAKKKYSLPQLEAMLLIVEASRKRRRIWRWVGGLSNSRHKSAEGLQRDGLLKAVKMPRSPNLTWRPTPEGWAFAREHFPA